jgi:hypothetical protein
MSITGDADPNVFKRCNLRRDAVQAEAAERRNAYLATQRGMMPSAPSIAKNDAGASRTRRPPGFTTFRRSGSQGRARGARTGRRTSTASQPCSCSSSLTRGGPPCRPGSRAELERWVEVTNRLSLAVCAEAVISVRCLGHGLEETVELLRNAGRGRASSRESVAGVGFGRR